MAVHATIDLETLNTRPDSVVMTIGAIKFDPYTGDAPYDDFYHRVNIDDQMEKGRTTSDSTLAWWQKQDKAIIEEAFAPDNREDVDKVLIELRDYLVGVDKIWCQGPVFDIGILENLYTQYNKKWRWNFWQICDSRTLFGLMPKDPRKEMNFAAHNALEDCRIQSICIQKVYSTLGIEEKK